MEGAEVTVVLAVLVSLAALFVTGDTCDGVPTMTWNETCLRACSTPARYNLCGETLQHEAERAEVTVYALAAARRAARAYDDTVDEAERLILGGKVPGGERPAYQRCIVDYGAARTEMAGVATDMAGCDFARTRREYWFAASALNGCGFLLKPGSPLATRNAADRDLTMLASDLGALVLLHKV
ncbi:hypothetical protein EJB05_09861, partial [Eragrostis curvula]